MPFYIDDFWGSEHVADMTDTEALLYQWCLGRQWQSGSLPADPVALKRLLPSRFAATFDESWPKVKPRFEIGTDARLRNKVLHEHLSEASRRILKAAESGKRGGLERVRRLAQASLEGSLKQPLKQPLKGRSSEPQALIGSDRTGSDVSVPTEQGSADAKPSSRKARGPRPPNAYEQAWYDTLRAHYGTEPAKLPPHGSIALGRVGKVFGPEAIAAKMRAVLADDKARKFLTPKYLEEHWDSIAARADLFSSGPTAPPGFLEEARRVLAMGPPPKGNTSAEATWKAVQDGLAKYRLTADDVRRSA